jgi:ribosomal protein S11
MKYQLQATMQKYNKQEQYKNTTYRNNANILITENNTYISVTGNNAKIQLTGTMQKNTSGY